MCEDINENTSRCSCKGGRMSRFLIPALLLLLAEKSSHGYELTERYSEFGFTEAGFDPGAIYRTLRLLESEGFIESRWETRGAGPAKRIYSITPDGLEMLSGWASDIKRRMDVFEMFLKRHGNLKTQKE
jgi:poly-beta-hydroxybutyrate-responsive repressor